MRKLLLLLALLPSAAAAHDWYSGLTNKAGQSCCGGNPVTGDCAEIDPALVSCDAEGCTVRFTDPRQHPTLVRMKAGMPMDLRYLGAPGISPEGVSACFTPTDAMQGKVRCLLMTGVS